MSERPGFVLLHTDIADLREDYTAEEIGRLVLALYAVSVGEEPERFEDRGLRGKFREMSRKIQKADETYRRKCAVNKENASMRWHATASDRIRPHAKEKEIVKINGKIEREGNKPPTLEAVREYALSKGYGFSCDVFFAYYQARGWDGVSDWQALADVWEQRERQSSRPQHFELERAHEYEQSEEQIIKELYSPEGDE